MNKGGGDAQQAYGGYTCFEYGVHEYLHLQAAVWELLAASRVWRERMVPKVRLVDAAFGGWPRSISQYFWTQAVIPDRVNTNSVLPALAARGE
jgi:hypothetical protein